MNFLVRLKRAIFGYKVTPEEKEAHRKEVVNRKAHILGAGARLTPEEDGIVRIRSLDDEDDKVCDDGGSDRGDNDSVGEGSGHCKACGRSD